MQDFEHEIQAFAAQIEEELREGRLNFPTALEVSLRIKRLANNPDTTLEEISAAVRTEPVLTAKAVSMANSVLLSPHGPRITTVRDAVCRIGLSALRCLAYAVAAEQLVQDQRSQKMRLLASGLWMHSVDVAVWSHAIARHLGAVKPDTAMLAGMMVDIGQFFLLARTTAYPALEENLERFAEFVSTWDQPIGRAVLEVFELPDTILDAFQYENPYGGSWPPQDLSDVVFIAGLAAETPNPFDTLLGVHPHALLETCMTSIDRARFDELLSTARNEREQLLAALVH